MNREQLLEKIRQNILASEPDATIILYGSRSRGDSQPESDWDFLILLNGILDDRRIDRIRHRLYKIEWESGEVISSVVRNYSDWNSNLYRSMLFHQRVEQEGITIC